MPSCLLLLLLIAPLRTAPNVDPERYASPSGAFVLEIDPKSRFGSGGARYRLTHLGVERWTREHPFTLSTAAVTDEGVALGYGHSSGFLVALLDGDGEVRVAERTKMTMSRFPHTPLNPRPLGLIADPSNDRFLVRIADEDVNRGVEAWWMYSISQAERVQVLRPREAMARRGSVREALLDARPLPGTPLYLLHWLTRGARGVSRGATFTLIRLDASVVWRLDLPEDYTIESDPRSEAELEHKLRESGAILDVEMGEFELRLVRDEQRVRFRTSVDSNGKTGWRVFEVGREEYSSEPEVQSVPLPLTLKQIDTVPLERRVPDPKPRVRDLCAWWVDEEGVFRAVRRDSGEDYSLLAVDANGGVLRELAAVELSATLAGTLCSWFPLGPDRWLVSRWNAPGRVLCVDVLTGDAEEIHLETRGGSKTRVVSAVPTAGGGFVALIRHHWRNTSTEDLVAFDSLGKRRWRVKSDYRDDAMLFTPKDVAVIPSGEVVVLELTRRELKLFADDGSYLETISLEESWGQRPNYPSGLASAPDGRLLVQDYSGAPPLRLMDPDGQLVRNLTPTYADGRLATKLARTARYGPDGTLWTFDGYRFLQLGDEGRVVDSVGKAAQDGVLYRPWAAAIDGFGRICMQDGRTGAMHVWDESGRLLFVGEVEPEDADGLSPIGKIASDTDGGVWGSTAQGMLGWSAEGERLGYRDASDVWAFGSGKPRLTKGESAKLVFHDSTGRVVAQVDRRPDRRWIRRVASVAIDATGEVAVLDVPERSARGDGTDVLLYSEAGEPLDTLALTDSTRLGRRLHYRSPWLLVSSWAGDVLLARRDTGEVYQVLVGSTDDRSWVHGLSSDGKRLLSVDKSRLEMRRFELPGD